MTRFPRSVCTIAVAIASALVSACQRVPVPPQLVLHAESAQLIPSAYSPSGASIDQNGAGYIWSADSAVILRITDSTLDAISLGANEGPLAVFPAEDEGGEAVFRLGCRIVRFGRDGRLVSEQPLTEVCRNRHLLSAVKSDSTWLLATRDDSQRVALWRVRRRGEPQLLRFLEQPSRINTLTDSLAVPATTLFLTTRGLLALDYWAPMAVQVLGMDGEELFRFAPPLDSLRRWTTGRADITLVGAGAGQLDGRFLVVIGDLKSTTRHLLLFDQAGRFLRSSMVDAPLGLVGSDLRNHRLLALRTTDRRELVYYSWQWLASPN